MGNKLLVKIGIETDIECAFKGFFGFPALLGAHIEVIVNAILKILHKIVNSLALIGDMGFFIPITRP